VIAAFGYCGLRMEGWSDPIWTHLPKVARRLDGRCKQVTSEAGSETDEATGAVEVGPEGLLSAPAVPSDALGSRGALVGVVVVFVEPLADAVAADDDAAELVPAELDAPARLHRRP